MAASTRRSRARATDLQAIAQAGVGIEQQAAEALRRRRRCIASTAWRTRKASVTTWRKAGGRCFAAASGAEVLFGAAGDGFGVRGEAGFAQRLGAGGAHGVVAFAHRARISRRRAGCRPPERPIPAGIGMWCTASGANSISDAQPSREASEAAWSMPPPRVPTNCSPSGRISISSSKVASRWLARSSARVTATIRADEDESPAAGGRSDSMVASMPFIDSPLAGDGLGGGAQVVLPIAAGDGGEGGSPVEFAVAVGFAGGARCGNLRAVGSERGWSAAAPWEARVGCDNRCVRRSD